MVTNQLTNRLTDWQSKFKSHIHVTKNTRLGPEKPGEDGQTDVWMDRNTDKQEDIRKFTPVSYRTSVLLDYYPRPAFGQFDSMSNQPSKTLNQSSQSQIKPTRQNFCPFRLHISLSRYTIIKFSLVCGRLDPVRGKSPIKDQWMDWNGVFRPKSWKNGHFKPFFTGV